MLNNSELSNTLISTKPVNAMQESMKANLIDYLKEQGVWDQAQSYKLPVSPDKESVYVLPVSGGKDSSALAVVMSLLFPSVNFLYVFTDTRAEPKDAYSNLRAIEHFTGKPLTRLSHELGLFGYIEHYGGFLPSGKDRWCTVELKIKIIDMWFKQTFDYSTQKVFSLVGFTYGEFRTGMITDEEEVESVYPLNDLKIDSDMVFGILDATIGIGGTYKTKSRSGCFCCPFLRRYEKVMMFFDRYDEFQTSKSYEKLCDADKDRFGLSSHPEIEQALYGANAIPLGRQDYYLPPAIDVRTEFLPHSLQPKTALPKDKLAKNTQQMNIFDFIDETEELAKTGYVYAAVGYWVSSTGRDFFADMSYSGLYRTENITFSRSLQGLKRSLHFWVEHKLSTAPLYGETRQEMQEDLKIGLFQIKLSDVFTDVIKDPSRDSYTWGMSESYMQIETVSRMINSVLKYEGWKQFYDNEYKGRYEGRTSEDVSYVNSFASYLMDVLEEHQEQYNKIGCSINWSGVFPLPSEDEIEQMHMDSILEKEDEEFKMSAAMTCAICSI